MKLQIAAESYQTSFTPKAFHIFSNSGATMLTMIGRGGEKCYRITSEGLQDKKEEA